MNKTVKELRKLAKDELEHREEELRGELFKLRTSGATEKVKDVMRFRKLRKDIARIQTLLREAQLKQAQA